MSMTRRSKRLQDRRNRLHSANANASTKMDIPKKRSRRASGNSTAEESDWGTHKKVPVQRSSRQTRYETRRAALRSPSRTSSVSIQPPKPRRRSTSVQPAVRNSVEESEQYKNLYERVKKRVRRVPKDCYHVSRFEEVQRQNRYNPFSSILRGKRTSGANIPRRRRRSRGCLSWMSTSSSSESENEPDKEEMFMKEEIISKRKECHVKRARPIKAASKDNAPNLFNGERMINNDFESVKLDKRITFESVGGHEKSIRVLKEMIIFPLMYEEVFLKFKIRPPRGVLFHGPPGTGKTLLARALANECSSGSRKVSFFMRKGADCLSKWVGESERQLKNLFEKAYLMRPSIIFFDEIDGLAPVRSSRQDQIHTSIVSTLLALMDGVECDSGIVVIGATNRIDFIDPALRRPGRFDREFYFGLPKIKVRSEILRIHTSDWERQLTDPQIADLAERTNGFCGADLQALCRDSVLNALRRTYPQVYRTKKRLNLDPEIIHVTQEDFDSVLLIMGSSAARTSSIYATPLPTDLKCILSHQTDSILTSIIEQFPAFVEHPIGSYLPKGHFCYTTFKPRFLIAGLPTSGVSSYIAPSILHTLETNVYAIDPLTLYSPSWRSIEEAIANQFRLAAQNSPSVIYLPRVDAWWNYLTESAQVMTLNAIQCLDPRSAVLLAITCDCPFEASPPAIQNLFHELSTVYNISCPEAQERNEFISKVFNVDLLNILIASPNKIDPYEIPTNCTDSEEDTLPEKTMNEAELEELWEREEAVMTSLRLFLREMLSRFVHDKRFAIFRSPVDPSQVSDYYDIVKQPIDLSLIMSKIDKHNYFTVDHFLEDMKLLLRNANLYNPDAAIDDRDLRHKASHLYDFVMSTVKNELHVDSHEEVKQIFRDRLARGAIKQIPVRYILYRSVNIDEIHQSPSNSLSTYSSQVFIRYQPVIKNDQQGDPLIVLREDDFNSQQMEPSDDNPIYKRILSIEPNDSRAMYYLECIPKRSDLTNGKKASVSQNSSTKKSSSRSKVVNLPKKRRDSAHESMIVKNLTKRLSELATQCFVAAHDWPLEKLQKLKSQIYSIVSNCSRTTEHVEVVQGISRLVDGFCNVDTPTQTPKSS